MDGRTPEEIRLGIRGRRYGMVCDQSYAPGKLEVVTVRNGCEREIHTRGESLSFRCRRKGFQTDQRVCPFVGAEIRYTHSTRHSEEGRGGESAHRGVELSCSRRHRRRRNVSVESRQLWR